MVLMLSLWFECILLLHSSEVKSFFKKILRKALKVLLSIPAGVHRAEKALFDVSARMVLTAVTFTM